MISDNRTIIFLLWHRYHPLSYMPQVGVVTHLHLHLVHNRVKFPPPLIALYPVLGLLVVLVS